MKTGILLFSLVMASMMLTSCGSITDAPLPTATETLDQTDPGQTGQDTPKFNGETEGNSTTELDDGFVVIGGEQYSTALTDLRIWHTELKSDDFAQLMYMKNLTELSLWNNQISDLSPLSGLTNLTKLELGANNLIKDLSPLSGLVNLVELRLSSNQISDLTPLSELTSLSSLSLGDNQITDLTPLANLLSLTELGLENNQIRDLSPLSVLRNLANLYLWGNQISDLSPLSGLEFLSELHIADNRIFDWSHVAHVSEITGMDRQTSEIMTAEEAKTILERWCDWNGYSYTPDMDKQDNGEHLFAFLVDYHTNRWNERAEPEYCYAWVNSATREFHFEEIGYSLAVGRSYYSNIPHVFFPLPMRDGVVIAYDHFTPPEYVWGQTYWYDDASVMETYKSQLRELGFSESNETEVMESYWTYQRENDGTEFYVEMYDSEAGFAMSLYFREPG